MGMRARRAGRAPYVEVSAWVSSGSHREAPCVLSVKPPRALPMAGFLVGSAVAPNREAGGGRQRTLLLLLIIPGHRGVHKLGDLPAHHPTPTREPCSLHATALPPCVTTPLPPCALYHHPACHPAYFSAHTLTRPHTHAPTHTPPPHHHTHTTLQPPAVPEAAAARGTGPGLAGAGGCRDAASVQGCRSACPTTARRSAVHSSSPHHTAAKTTPPALGAQGGRWPQAYVIKRKDNHKTQ